MEKGLKLDDKGLIPAIVQDAESGDVLMLGYMNKESIGLTAVAVRSCGKKALLRVIS